MLPFTPLAVQQELHFLCEAIPHEIIEALSRLRWLAVLARGSTFRFHGPTTGPAAVAATLSARYVLTGFIEGRNRRVAVMLELVDTRSGQVLWADRLVAPIDDIDDLRARIVVHLVSALETHIPFNEARIASQNGPGGGWMPGPTIISAFDTSIGSPPATRGLRKPSSSARSQPIPVLRALMQACPSPVFWTRFCA